MKSSINNQSLSDKHRNRREREAHAADTTKVVDIRKGSYDVYIGRRRNGSMHYGNPFSTNPDLGIECSTEEEAILRYSLWLEGKLLPHVEPKRRLWILDNVKLLRGKSLGCFCDSLVCHGDILIKLLKETK